jgi:hypothetical protein
MHITSVMLDKKVRAVKPLVSVPSSVESETTIAKFEKHKLACREYIFQKCFKQAVKCYGLKSINSFCLE